MCFDGESPTVFDETHPVARKEHRCCECGEIIPIGARHQYVSGLWDGSWSHYRTCARCEADRDRIQNVEESDGCHGAEAVPAFGELLDALKYYQFDRSPPAASVGRYSEPVGGKE